MNALKRYGRPGLHAVLSPSVAIQPVRRHDLRPIEENLSIRFLNFDVDIAVRIRPFYSFHCSRELELLAVVKLTRLRMMRENVSARQKQTGTNKKHSQQISYHPYLL